MSLDEWAKNVARVYASHIEMAEMTIEQAIRNIEATYPPSKAEAIKKHLAAIEHAERPTHMPFARCLVCGMTFYDTEHARTTGVWCPHVSFVYNKEKREWMQEKGRPEDVLWFWRWKGITREKEHVVAPGVRMYKGYIEDLVREIEDARDDLLSAISQLKVRKDFETAKKYIMQAKEKLREWV